MDAIRLEEQVFQVNANGFEALALEVFRYQALTNDLYRSFLQHLQINVNKVTKVSVIPFLPISFFKSHRILSGIASYEAIFESSGTTGITRSRHYVYRLAMYDQSLFRGFELFYGPPKQYHFFALLPSYLERQNASLVYMVEKLIQAGGSSMGGFYLNDFETLYRDLESAKEDSGRKIFLIGVPFALLDFGKDYPVDLKGHILMETGGMKGRGEELVREELHGRLKAHFNLDEIHSEYGMTELLSQAYATEAGNFRTPPWMRMLFREPNDPFAFVQQGQTGGINIIDLANLYSCSFIATQDIGRLNTDGSFEVLGRFDHSDIRGCSLLYS